MKLITSTLLMVNFIYAAEIKIKATQDDLELASEIKTSLINNFEIPSELISIERVKVPCNKLDPSRNVVLICLDNQKPQIYLRKRSTLRSLCFKKNEVKNELL